jgi:hypothetical protein
MAGLVPQDLFRPSTPKCASQVQVHSDVGRREIRCILNPLWCVTAWMPATSPGMTRIATIESPFLAPKYFSGDHRRLPHFPQLESGRNSSFLSFAVRANAP